MFLSKLKLAGLMVLALTLLASGAGLLASRPPSPSVRAAAPPRSIALAAVKPEDPPKAGSKSTAPPAKKEDDKRAAKEGDSDGQPPTAAELSSALSAVVEFGGIDDAAMPLSEVLAYLSKVLKVPIDVNEQAFLAEDLNNVHDVRLVEQRPLPPMKRTLRTVLLKVLARVPVASGAMLMIRRDHLEVTTRKAVCAELGVPLKAEPAGRAWDPLSLVFVDYSKDKQTLAEALRAVASQTDTNIVVDPRAEEKTNVKVGLRLANVPVATAVALLADMAELDVVRLDNVFYVTLPEKAEKMRAKKKP
jgi:hypothetical protein